MLIRNNMGLVPDHWGPYVWGAIHLICLGAPEKLDSTQQQAYRQFFEQLPYVLPCASCSEHLQQNLGKVPISGSLATREDLFAWSVRLHNLVNAQLKKPELSLDQARQYWDAICRGTKTPGKGCEEGANSGFNMSSKKVATFSWTTLYFVLVFLFGLFIGYFLFHSSSNYSQFRAGLRSQRHR